ncbi:MAG: exonuclease SbcCD subunit D [Chloroflexi bacterium]|nr:exonuclease SbcCD subunit D [Chloroflexota bacterium]
MLRILHAADLHLGVETYGHINPETGLNTRLEDCLTALDEAVDYALNNDVSLFLFCGDAYKSREPSQTHQREFALRLRRMAAASIPVFLLVGNHDLPAALGRATTMDIFPALAVARVTVARQGGTYLIETRHGPLQIIALPWASRSSLLAQEEYKSLPAEEVNRLMEKKLTDFIQQEADSLRDDIPAIMAAHWAFSDAVPGSERTMTLGRDPVLLPSSVPTRLDYVALGHIHRHQSAGGGLMQPLRVYSGSLQAMDFGDEGQEKGFCVVDLDERQSAGKRVVDFQFHKVTNRPFVTIRVDVRGREPTATVLQAIASAGGGVAGAIVRLQIRLSLREEGMLQETQVRRALQEAHHFVIAREIVQEQRTRLGDVLPQELTPLKALELYLASRQTDPERAQELMKYAAELIGGDGAFP